MDKETFEFLKQEFYILTGKYADDNLEAFFGFANSYLLLDIKTLLTVIRANQPNPNAGLR